MATDIIALSDLRYTVSPNYSFPIHVTKLDNINHTLKCFFFGLYGLDSPLPHYLQSPALYSLVYRNFLDVLHQRFYQAYFLSLHWQMRHNDFSNILSPLLKNRYLILHVAKQYHLPNCQLQSPKLRWQAITSGQQLGNNIILGNKICSRQASINIMVGPIAISALSNLYPRLLAFEQKIKIEFAINYDVQIQITCCHTLSSPLALGRDNIVLALQSVLLNGAQSFLSTITLEQLKILKNFDKIK